ncbi:MAG: sulfotransferase domain-containing protein [Crocosphaera sp.]|nr:sulfotransferase domain-containing protein [Crocosphaera sp.]
MNDSSLNYVLLLGKGRSGTTWLAKILDSYEYSCYKNEPFPPSKKSPYYPWLENLEATDRKTQLLSFERICRHCYITVDNQPQGNKYFLNQNKLLLKIFRGLARRIQWLQFLYEWYGYLPLTSKHPVVIKDVTLGTPPGYFYLPQLLEVLQPHLIIIIRNPFANIASLLKGRSLGVFGTWSQLQVKKYLQQIIDSPMGDSFKKYRDHLDDLTVTEFEALRWLIEAEILTAYSQTYTPSLVVIYEELCLNPLEKTEEIFEFLGWELGQTTQDFIKASTSGQSILDQSVKSQYYSTYRDPKNSLSKWQKQLTPQQVQEISSIIDESPLKSLWPNIFSKS